MPPPPIRFPPSTLINVLHNTSLPTCPGKTSEYEAYVSGESSSGQVNVEEPGPSISGNQEQDDEFDFWRISYASKDDEIPTKQDDEHQYHIDQMKNFLQSDIV
ncbi:hypothetical protein Tco_0963218 [Tanacetum coccineum]